MVRAAPTVPVPIEFWFIAPNEGESAGGHAAIRIGELVYHVERRGDGLIADRRTPRTRFEEVYRGRGNRSIEAIPLALDRSQIVALRSQLDARFFERGRRLDRLDALENLERWLDRAFRQGYFGIEIPGLGLYESGAASCTRPDHAGYAGLRREIDAQHGRGWLRARLDRARRETLHQLSQIVGAAEAQQRPMSGGDPGGALRRLQQGAQTWAAFEILSDCRSLRPDRMHSTPLAGAEVGKLLDRWRQVRAALVIQLQRLIQSERSDIGMPLLVAWARWGAIDRSIATGRLHVLDPFVELGDAENTAAASFRGEMPDAWMPMLRSRGQKTWRSARADFEANRGPLEVQLIELERASHALSHTRDSTLHRAPVAASPSASASERLVAAEWVLPWPNGLVLASLANVRHAVSAEAEILRGANEADLQYRLLTRNCVTELIPELASPIAFIPVVAAQVIEKTMSAGPRRRMHGARELALDRQRKRSRNFLSGLRETMTLTSRTYRPNAADSRFLFFSDGPVWARPLIGLANLGYGMGAMALGILEAPWDRGAELRRGVQGILMSGPELVFLQVRRGSYPVLPPLDLSESIQFPAVERGL